MSNASSDHRLADGGLRPKNDTSKSINWSPWIAVIFVVVVYYLAQIIGGLLISLYPALRHWSSAQTNDWVQNSVGAQFVYVLVAESLTLGALWQFLRLHKTPWKSIGLTRPKWSDAGWGLVILPAYYLTYYVVAIVLVKALVPSLNLNQQQQIGFTDASGFGLLLTFVSLVVLPPLVEEILVRGYLYGSLRKGLPVISAALVTSVIFASAHLQAGSGAPLLWIAFIDTFVLSLFLIYLREKTGRLWAGITLHASKNLLAFVTLFILHVH